MKQLGSLQATLSGRTRLL